MTKGRGAVSYLTRDGEPVSVVHALDDAANVLDGAHELHKLVGAQVGEARGEARQTHEYVCLKSRKRSANTIVLVSWGIGQRFGARTAKNDQL